MHHALLSLVASWKLLVSGVASYYTKASSGPIMASGKPMRDDAPICAMRNVKLGTLVRVLNTRNGRSATCRILDRGPYYGNRVIDVSEYIRRQLGFSGLAYVKVYVKK